MWEVVVAMTLCLGATVGLVWASGKIFRIGVLAQGQTPSFRQLLTWVTAK
jgi:ABC-2 type transport system permease protein